MNIHYIAHNWHNINKILTHTPKKILNFLKNETQLFNFKAEVKTSWGMSQCTNWNNIYTQINIIQTYDFEKDSKQIIPDIKNKTAWMNVEDARNYILSTYDEIWNVKISVPLRYSSIPVIKSRIKLQINN